MLNKTNQTIYFSTYDDVKNPFYGGGGAIAVHEVAKRLAKKYNVRVLCWDYCGNKKEIINGVRYERFGLPFLSPKASMFAYQMALPFVAKGKKFDLMLESFCPPFTTSFFPLFCKKPVVGIVHMLAAEDMERKYKLPFHLIQNKGLKMYNRMIVTSEEIRRKVHSINPYSLLTVISNGIEKVETTSSKKQKYILFLGRIEVDQKGIDLLLNAFKKFQEINSEYQLIIAGTGAPKEITKMKSLIKLYLLDDNVVLKGKVTGHEKETLLRQATCVVITSRFETYSLVALEAIAHGTPVVCFAINGLSWIPESIAKKVSPFNIKAFVQAISFISSNPFVADKMSKEGINYAKNFTWDVITEQYINYLEKELTR